MPASHAEQATGCGSAPAAQTRDPCFTGGRIRAALWTMSRPGQQLPADREPGPRTPNKTCQLLWVMLSNRFIDERWREVAHDNACVRVRRPYDATKVPATGLWSGKALLVCMVREGQRREPKGRCIASRGLLGHPQRPCMSAEERAGRTPAAGGQDIALGPEIAARLAHWVTRQILCTPTSSASCITHC